MVTEGVATVPSDSELVEASRRGDTAAFAELYERHRGAVFAAVSSRIGGAEIRRDLTQEVFATALAKLESLSDPTRFRAWVLQIGRNAAIDVLRKREREGRTESFDDLTVPPPSSDAGPATVAEMRDLQQRVTESFGSLSTRDATALALSVHMGFGPSDMALALGVTPNNAKVILHRARTRLRRAVEAS